MKNGENMIIQAKQEHRDEIYHLICILENQTINKDHFIHYYQKAFMNEDIHLYVYIKDEKVIGFISMYVHHYFHHHQDTGEIVELIVDPHYRGLKIGEQLLVFIEKIAQERQLEEIELSTSTYRKKAHHFYEVHGYSMNHYNYTKKLK